MMQNPQRKVAACMAPARGVGSLQKDVLGGGVPRPLLRQETRQQTSRRHPLQRRPEGVQDPA